LPKYDAIIIGAGILGLATAYHIKREKPNQKVLVIDKKPAAGQGNTAKSGGMFRSFFYSKTNFKLANSSIEFYKRLEESGVDLGMRWTGYLWLFQEDQYKRLEADLKEMERRGGEFKLIDRREIEEKLNINTKAGESEEAEIMNLKNIDIGLLVPKAGKIDVEKLVSYYEREFLRMGGEVIYGTEVDEIIVEPEIKLELPGEPYFWQEAKVSGVRVGSKIIRGKKIIVATGVWADQLLDGIGVDSYQKPKKRQIFVVKAEEEKLKRLLYAEGFNREGCIPFTILPYPRIYVKPSIEEEAFWIGYADDFNRPFQLEEDPQPEENYYRYGIYPVLSAYMPQFKDANPINAWAGQYAINTFDGQPVIFEERNLIVVGAASGSGIMKADAIGRIASALYFGREKAELYGGEEFKVEHLGIKNRYVEREEFVI